MRSTPADDAGRPRYWRAILHRVGRPRGRVRSAGLLWSRAFHQASTSGRWYPGTYWYPGNTPPMGTTTINQDRAVPLPLSTNVAFCPTNFKQVRPESPVHTLSESPLHGKKQRRGGVRVRGKRKEQRAKGGRAARARQEPRAPQSKWPVRHASVVPSSYP